MKKWNKPELLTLGVENTFEACDCEAMTIAKDPDKNTHYCHADGKAHANNCASWKDSDHKQNAKCSGPHWGYEHVSKCCCGTGDIITAS